MRTSFHHQPEAQHPKFFSYPQAAGRLPHLWVKSGKAQVEYKTSAFTPLATFERTCRDVGLVPIGDTPRLPAACSRRCWPPSQ